MSEYIYSTYVYLNNLYITINLRDASGSDERVSFYYSLSEDNVDCRVVVCTWIYVEVTNSQSQSYGKRVPLIDNKIRYLWIFPEDEDKDIYFEFKGFFIGQPCYSKVNGQTSLETLITKTGYTYSEFVFALPPPLPPLPPLPLPPLPPLPPRPPPAASFYENFFQTSASLIGGQPAASVLILTPSFQLVKDGGPMAYSISSVRQDCSTSVNMCTWTVVESYAGSSVALTMNTNDYVWVLPYDVPAAKIIYAFTPPPWVVYGEYQFTGSAMPGLRKKISATPPVEGYSA